MENPNENFREEGSRHIEIPQSKEKYMKYFKNVLLFLLLVVLIIGSFWVSFNLGKKILAPVRKPEAKIEVAIPEPPPSIAGLQSLEELEEIEEPAAMVSPKTAVRPGPAPTTTTVSVPAFGKYYKVQAGFFHNKDNALRLAEKIRASGFSTYVPKKGSGWRVQVGAYSSKTYARIQQNSLKKKGFDAIIIYE